MVQDSDVLKPVVGEPTTDNPAAPVIFFDNAPTSGISNGTVAVVLTVLRNLPGPNGQVVVDSLVSGHLRCSVQSAIALRSALDNALLLAMPSEGKSN